MEMASVNDSVQQQKQTTVEPSLLSLRHVDNLIPTFNRPGALASGIILIITGLLTVGCMIVLDLLMQKTGAPESSRMRTKYSSDKLWFPYLVSVHNA